MKFKLNRTEIIFILGLIIIGILTRTVLHIKPNLEFVTACSLAAGFFLKDKKLSLVVPFLIMLFTDLIIGNTIIFLFTWSAFFIAPAMGSVLNSRKIKKLFGKKENLRLLVTGMLGGLAFTLIFFLWTNLGVMLTSGMYAHTFEGLMQSYINALPFLRIQLFGNLIIVPIVLLTTKIYFDTLKLVSNNLNLHN